MKLVKIRKRNETGKVLPRAAREKSAALGRGLLWRARQLWALAISTFVLKVLLEGV